MSVLFSDGSGHKNRNLLTFYIYYAQYAIWQVKEVQDGCSNFVSVVSQEQLSTMQTKLDEEESKNIRLQQHINKLEHHSAQIEEVR